MAKSRRVDLIEIPMEVLDRGPRGAAGIGASWADAPTAATPGARSRSRSPTTSPEAAPRAAGAVGTATFRRLVGVPGDHLGAVLGAWWQQQGHNDGHLRLDAPGSFGDSWSLDGAFRRTLVSRWVPVELVLSPYAERWSLLELMPRRGVQPSRVYFRAGHRSLDQFVAAIRAQDELAEHRSTITSPLSPPDRVAPASLRPPGRGPPSS